MFCLERVVHMVPLSHHQPLRSLLRPSRHLTEGSFLFLPEFSDVKVIPPAPAFRQEEMGHKESSSCIQAGGDGSLSDLWEWQSLLGWKWARGMQTVGGPRRGMAHSVLCELYQLRGWVPRSQCVCFLRGDSGGACAHTRYASLTVLWTPFASDFISHQV